eukprot:7232333-Lingulodinium_polyedra.AAC.1
MPPDRRRARPPEGGGAKGEARPPDGARSPGCRKARGLSGATRRGEPPEMRPPEGDRRRG